MKSLLLHDKRAVSEIVSYVLLIVIAVGISVLVYVYLSLFVPKEKFECPESVSLIVADVKCAFLPPGGTAPVQLNLTLVNKGRFTVDAAYIRLGNGQKKVKDLVNSKDVFLGIINRQQGLIPGESVFKRYIFDSSRVIVGENTLEIEPAVGKPQRFALCEQAVITQPITCTNWR